ncbi:hypothetical protein ABEB36_014714 [Hypothenemus hampei]
MTYESIIASWRLFQKNKIIMANQINCSLESEIVTIPSAVLSFHHNIGQIKICGRIGNLTFLIERTELVGWTPDEDEEEGLNIVLRIRQESRIINVTLTLPNVNLKNIVLNELQNFDR